MALALASRVWVRGFEPWKTRAAKRARLPPVRIRPSVERQALDEEHNRKAREIFDFEAWMDAGCPPADEWGTGG